MVRLGRIELIEFRHLGHDRIREGFLRGQAGSDFPRDVTLRLVMPEDGGTILRTVVVALPVARGRIVIAKKASRIPRYVTLAGSNSSCWPLPFTAAQILWINLVTDGLEDVALAFEPGGTRSAAPSTPVPKRGSATPMSANCRRPTIPDLLV